MKFTVNELDVTLWALGASDDIDAPALVERFEAERKRVMAHQRGWNDKEAGREAQQPDNINYMHGFTH